MKFEEVSLDDMPKVARTLVSSQGKIILFRGDLGAGKTTLIKEICGQKGVTDPMSSPTFSIVNEYSAGTELVYHFDLYRIEDESELYDLGFEDYLDSGHTCLIEWPEIGANILQDYDTVNVEIQHGSGATRRIFVS